VTVFSQRDRGNLRALAERVAELASRPIEKEKEQLWREHNALAPTRPLIFCDPENGWNEIILPAALTCEDELARQWEFTLRKEIFWCAQIKDDRVIRPVFDVPHVYAESDWGMHETRIGGENGGSYGWEAPLKDFSNFDKLHFPVITVDWEQTHLRQALAQEVFTGILNVRLYTQWWWTLGLTQTYANLRGLTQMLMDFIQHPNDMHRLMAFLRDGTLCRLDFLEQNGLLASNTCGDYVGSGGFGWSNEFPAPARDVDGFITTKDMWGFAEAQETIGVSPKMFAEFTFPYQISILERFGLNCYGCCEPLDKRWESIRSIPRLRRVSVSPWTDIPKMAEYLGSDYIFSLKPSPTPLASPAFDEEVVRTELREKLAHLNNCCVEIIMKDNHTIANDPRRVIRWVEIARQESEK
jgi:hypothetical protein